MEHSHIPPFCAVIFALGTRPSIHHIPAILFFKNQFYGFVDAELGITRSFAPLAEV